MAESPEASPMVRSRVLLVAAMVVALAPAAARAQLPGPLPLPPGTRHSIKIDSSPQQAAIYVNDKGFGIQAYTPSTLKLPKGTYKLILELPGFKTREVPISVTRAQAFSITLERAARPAILDLRPPADASGPSALGAAIFVDGTAVGTLPNRIEVGAGRHVVEVKKQGFADFRDNVDTTEGETRTMIVALVPAVRPGAIVVSADVQGATVMVDGVTKDTAPTLLTDLPEGPHTVEVRKEGLQPFRQIVTVVAGQQVKVVAQLQPAAPSAGSVKVISATPNADVFLDGDPKGPAGVEIKPVQPGSHIVEVRAQGFQSKRQEVQVAAGEMRVVGIDLAPEVAAVKLGGVHVISPIPDVDVYIDGALAGKAPVQRNDLAVGKHFIVVRKPGFADFKTEVDLQPRAAPVEIAADLRSSGSLRVITNVAGSDVFLDGTPVGKTPLTLSDVAAGDHVVELKLKDYLDAKQVVHVDGGAQQIVTADLVPIQKGPTLGDIERSLREQSSYGATTLPGGRFNVDFGAGYPSVLFARLVIGIFKTGTFGIDLGVELRTFLYDTQVGLRPRVQFFQAGPFSLGADLTIMGGGGPTKRNSFTFEVGPIATLAAGQYVHINFKPYLDVWSDRLCPSVADIKDDDGQTGTMAGGTIPPGSGQLYKGDTRHACKEYVTRTDTSYTIPGDMMVASVPFGQADPRDRFVGARFMLQLSLEAALTRSISVWVLIEGAPGQAQRMTYNSMFNALFFDNDFPLYGRAGITGKF
jgi:hypothetical protein